MDIGTSKNFKYEFFNSNHWSTSLSPQAEPPKHSCTLRANEYSNLRGATRAARIGISGVAIDIADTVL